MNYVFYFVRNQSASFVGVQDRIALNSVNWERLL